MVCECVCGYSCIHTIIFIFFLYILLYILLYIPVSELFTFVPPRGTRKFEVGNAVCKYYPGNALSLYRRSSQAYKNDFPKLSWGTELNECFGDYNILLGPKALYFKIKKTKRKHTQNKFRKLEGVGALKKPAARVWNPIWRAGSTRLLGFILIQIHGRINQQRLKCLGAGMNVTKAEGTSEGVDSDLCGRVATIQFIFLWAILKTERESRCMHMCLHAEEIPPPFWFWTDPLSNWLQVLQLVHIAMHRFVCLMSCWKQTRAACLSVAPRGLFTGIQGCILRASLFCEYGRSLGRESF